MLNKTLLGSAAVIMTMVGAQAADLPSKKAAPATYVKICDAYGAGFFFIPGGETCVRVGGYVRAEYQYTPGKNVYAGAKADTVAAYQTVDQVGGAQASAGYEARGRVELDARTPTSMGVARTFIRMRSANTSGIRGATSTVQGTAASMVTNVDSSATGINLEAAMVQWAGFSFGVAPENYAMMPGIMYNGMPWAGFPNGMKQIAYTATLGGGWSATVALEDRNDSFNGSSTAGTSGALQTAANALVYANANQYVSQLNTVANLVGNIRLDQAWGFAAISGMVGNNSLRQDATTAGNNAFAYNALQGAKTYSAYAIGGTVRINLPMIAAGDYIIGSANYASGMTGALMGGGLSSVSNAAQRRELGGIIRNDTNLYATGGAGTAADPWVIGSTKGWNVNAIFVHNWSSTWRSNFAAGYVEINPPTAAAGRVIWGKGQLYVGAASLIYSPVRNLDIGLELQYANVKNKIQNESANFIEAGRPGTSSDNYSTKLRVERSF